MGKKKKKDINPLTFQTSGKSHYQKGGISMLEYIHSNNIGFNAANVLKYIVRHKNKNKLEDIAKVIHYALLEAKLEYGADINEVLALLGLEAKVKK